MQPHLPRPRGPVSEALTEILPQRPTSFPPVEILCHGSHPEEDLQLSLHICYGLHYDGFEGVSEEWEWAPLLQRLRQRLEEEFLGALVQGSLSRRVSPGAHIDLPRLSEQLQDLLVAESGPSLSTYLCEAGDREKLREFVVHRSIYQRKEADPHTWVIPRVRGRAKSALVHLQADEYGGGRPGRSHADLFAATMRSLGLDPAPGAYIDQVPGVTLATDNLISFFGLHRRWRGALVGHLAAFEMTSVVPMSRYASAIRRIIQDEQAAEFYDVHVQADVAHGQIAASDLVLGLAESDPDAAADILFGAASLLGVERRFANHLLDSWAGGSTSLYREPTAEEVPLPTGHKSICLEDLRLDHDCRSHCAPTR